MLLNSGITIQSGIEMMMDDENDKDGKTILENLQSSLEKGESLSYALLNGGFFPPYMINMVELGEKTGHLPEILKALGEYYERQERLRVSIKNATLYPVVMLTMIIGIVMILIIQVLPIFNDVFRRMGARMSPFASQLMELGIWFRRASVATAMIFCIILAAVFLAWVIPGVRENIFRAVKSKWGSRWVFGRIASSQFASSMAVAMSGGLDIEESVSLAASLNQSSKALNMKHEKCVSLLSLGSNLSDALREAEILSARDARMLSLGSNSGMADIAMMEIARRSDLSVQDEIATIVRRIEPTFVIITSVIVGIVLLSIMLPLIGIMTSIGTG